MTSSETSDKTEEATAPATIPFSELGLSDAVLKSLKDVGYEIPSAIQAATIPILLEGKDVVGLAQTGTGKTAAFALPILSRLDLSQKSPQALVLAPTRELALQVCEAFEKYASHMKGVHVLPVYGGQGYGTQLSALRRGVHIVVGTPGRIMDHLEKGTLDLTELKYLVLDEADEMLKMGFAEDVETILADTPADKQVALFSATMPAQIRRISKQYLNEPEEVTIKSKTTTSSTITQRYLMVSYPQKVDALTRILEVENFEGMIIFTRTKNETETLAEKLRARGYSAMAINGDVPQATRERTVEQLKSGKLDILVATDVAARGLDVERISHVVNFDIPIDTESYVHRIGRTGRAGASGLAVTLVSPSDMRLVSDIEKLIKNKLQVETFPLEDDRSRAHGSESRRDDRGDRGEARHDERRADRRPDRGFERRREEDDPRDRRSSFRPAQVSRDPFFEKPYEAPTAEQASAAQSAHHKQEGVAGQKGHDHQARLDKHYQEQQGVDPSPVIPDESLQIAVDVKYKVQQLQQGVHAPIIPVFCPFKVGAKPGAGTPTI